MALALPVAHLGVTAQQQVGRQQAQCQTGQGQEARTGPWPAAQVLTQPLEQGAGPDAGRQGDDEERGQEKGLVAGIGIVGHAGGGLQPKGDQEQGEQGAPAPQQPQPAGHGQEQPPGGKLVDQRPPIEGQAFGQRGDGGLGFAQVPLGGQVGQPLGGRPGPPVAEGPPKGPCQRQIGIQRQWQHQAEQRQPVAANPPQAPIEPQDIDGQTGRKEDHGPVVGQAEAVGQGQQAQAPPPWRLAPIDGRGQDSDDQQGVEGVLVGNDGLGPEQGREGQHQGPNH